MAKENLTQIKVETLPNGYSLTVYQKSYLYFNETELFEGLIYHAGMAIVKDNDKKVIREVVANLLAGETAVLMMRNQEQQSEIATLQKKAEKLAKTILTLKKKMEKLTRKPVDIEDFEL